ncbi:hypothetical protein SH1V18_17220 [Vallitalea longa]|uniref:Uncharacterized protein n=1 Tax=Vallitalea longa TaxID=2936439 RepID=A0A9W5Y8N4_9FIRM|nr:hypothetical protein [Vallitalea longa]GKX29242.1 hypothetical protein SH1V18_17220 [Vallitalea longa]
MSDLSIIQGISNINDTDRGNDIKEGLRMSVISMAMNIGTFKVNLTVNKSYKLEDKKNKRHMNTSRIRKAIRTKDEKMIEHCMCNYIR